MNNKSIPVDAECSTQTYYFRTDTFVRPIKISVHTNYHSQEKATQAIEAALWPTKVIECITPSEGLSFMSLPGTYDAEGRQLTEGA